MKITICIGSSCHLKGAPEIAGVLEKKINENNFIFVVYNKTKSTFLQGFSRHFYRICTKTTEFYYKKSGTH